MTEKKNYNHLTFGIGTIGRDMVYTMVSSYLIYYLTDIAKVSTTVLWWITGIVLFARIFDACNDPIMGVIVDNTRTRFGKFKPWIAIGAFLSGIITILIFTDFHLSDTAYIIVFGITYLCWGMSFTVNDIAYWSMLPSLSFQQKEREKIGSLARIFANLGMFFVVAGIVPITTALGEHLGNMKQGYFVFAIIIVAIMWAGQFVTLIGAHENRSYLKTNDHTSLKGMVNAIFKNDQLLYIAITMVLCMIGYVTTTSFGIYFFKYAYGDENMYSIFAIILGISQITALSVFPIFRKRFLRRQLYQAATFIVIVGYIIFFFAPTNTMLFIGIAGILMFVGQAFIQLMMLMFLTDTVEYGHWKFGKRNDSVTLSLQPFIYKLSGAVSSGIVSVIIILSGIKDAESASDVTEGGLLLMKAAMLIFPLICILLGYLLYRKKYVIDEKLYSQIREELESRGDFREETNDGQ